MDRLRLNQDLVAETSEEADGTLVLEPAVVITELERRFMSNAIVQAQIEYAKEHPEQRRERTPRAAR